MHDVRLVINALSFGGWKALTIRRSMEEFARSFNVTFNDRWEHRQQPVPIIKGEAFDLGVDSERMIQGWVDDVSIDYSADSHSLTAAGRSFTGDLIDCSATVSGGKRRRWHDKSIRQIATDLCAPFGLTVISDGVDDVIDKKLPRDFAIDRGDTVYDALSRLADLRGILLQTTPDGDPLFTRAGRKKVKTVLRFGENIKTCRYTSSDRERFSHYTFRGQTSADDNWNGEAATKIKGFAQDTEIARFRPHEVTAMVQTDKKDLGFRAIWERNTRAGRSEVITYTVPGWKHSEGLWSENTLVSVDDTRLRIRDEMLISAVTFQASAADGFTTEIEVVDKRTYDVVGVPKVKRTRPPATVQQQFTIPPFVTWEQPRR